MKIDQVKEIINSVFEEDEALKYALATNIAKYGRPQSKPSDKPAKLTKGLEKKREKAVKDLKKTMDEGMNDEKAVQAIAAAVADYTNVSNDKFLQGIIRTALGSGYMEERVVSDNESPSLKAKIAAEDFMRGYRTTLRRVEGNFGKEAAEEFKEIVLRKFSQMNESVNEVSSKEKEIYAKIEKLRVLSNSGKITGDQFLDKFYPLARQLKGMKESVNEDEGTLNKIADMLSRKFDDLRFDVNTVRDRIDVRGYRDDVIDFGEELQGKKIFDYEVFYIEEEPTRGAIVRIVKSDSIMREDKKKADRCLRIARRKMPQSSAYRSGLIVKCRKGMIWKKEK